MLIDRNEMESSNQTNSDDTVVEIAEIVGTEKGDDKPSQKIRMNATMREKTASSLIIQINRVLTFISLVSFVAIIIYPLINPAAKLPDVIPNTFFMTMGYFASALITYLEPKKGR